MQSEISNILNGAIAPNGRRLNILSWPTHERYQSNLRDVNAHFFLLRHKEMKDWHRRYAPLPANHTLLAYAADNWADIIPHEVKFDAVLCQNKQAHYPHARGLAQSLNIPLICLEHCLPNGQDIEGQIAQHKMGVGDVNVFISEMNRDAWGYSEDNAVVVKHGVDTEFFTPGNDRTAHILTVANDYRNRGSLLGWDLYKKVTEGLPVCPVGDTPGLSQAAANVHELRSIYQKSRIFLNTSLISPIPSVMLEAAACGCAIVSTSNCMIPSIFTHGHDALLSNDEGELRNNLEKLLKFPGMAEQFGKNARKTMVEKYNLNQFTQSWNEVLEGITN